MLIKAHYYHNLALSAYFALFSLLMLWNTAFYPSTHFPVVMILIFGIAPLLLPLRGFLNANPRSCAWMAYLSIGYFMHGAMEAYVNPVERPLATLEVICSLLLFSGTTLFIRFHARP
jgi:uncharacterized membrane protein